MQVVPLLDAESSRCGQWTLVQRQTADGRTFVGDFDQAMQRKMTLVEGPSSESP